LLDQSPEATSKGLRFPRERKQNVHTIITDLNRHFTFQDAVLVYLVIWSWLALIKR